MSKRPPIRRHIDERIRRNWRRQRLPGLLVTGGASDLAQALVPNLVDAYNLRLLDERPVPESDDVETLQGSLLNDADVWQAVRGVDAIVHVALAPGESRGDDHLLDLAGRGTYALFGAAIDAGVRQFVLVSSLDLFSAYPDDVYISEEWKPQPSLDLAATAPFLAEEVAREFVREHDVTVACLRLGNLTPAPGEPNLLSLDTADATQAVLKALEKGPSGSRNWVRRWSLYHITSEHANPRYLITKAKDELGYEPEHRF